MNRRDRKKLIKEMTKVKAHIPLNLVKVSSEEIRRNRNSAYKLLLP